jgi:hypothetical protein
VQSANRQIRCKRRAIGHERRRDENHNASRHGSGKQPAREAKLALYAILVFT